MRGANYPANVVTDNPKAIFRLNRDRTMGLYQDLVVKMTAGEKMRKRSYRIVTLDLIYVDIIGIFTSTP